MVGRDDMQKRIRTILLKTGTKSHDRTGRGDLSLVSVVIMISPIEFVFDILTCPHNLQSNSVNIIA